MLTEKEIIQIRLYNGSNEIIRKLDSFDAERIIVDTYISTKHPIFKEIAKRYEYALITAKTNPDKFVKDRYNFHQEFAEWLKKENRLKYWVRFIHFMQRLEKKQHNPISHAYYSEVMETWNSLTGLSEKMYGLKTNGELIVRNEYYGDWDKELLRIQKKIMTSNKRSLTDAIAYHNFNDPMNDPFKKAKISLLKSYVLENSKQEFTAKCENILDICLIGMLPFINEDTIDLYPDIWLPHADERNIPKVRQWKDTSFYKEQLKHRKYMIHKKGVKLLLKNAGDISEVIFKEIITPKNKIVMLYRLTTSKGSTVGYYHISDDMFHSAYFSSSSKFLHSMIENFMLELYSNLVTGLEIDVKRIYALKEVEDIENIENFKSTNIYVEHQKFKSTSGNATSSKISGTRKRGYKQKAHTREMAIRKLRPNQKASERAILEAQKSDIILPEGTTFVRRYKVGNKIEDVRTKIKKPIS